ncbi:MAG: group II truncated hemoglobin [Pseudomonadales bacterium]|nr:group II truncated hemoglobin [Pseudomonadales bacterium]
MNMKTTEYGTGDNSYKSAGELFGISSLVDDFYLNMAVIPECKKIRAMHPADLGESSQKLKYFLSGWLGGPKLYLENYGPIDIPAAHQHLSIGTSERDAWLICMQKAIAKQPWEEDFKRYLNRQIRIPAERIAN